MRHAKDHITLRPILEPGHFGAHLIPASGLLPDISGMHHGHGDFLATDSIHLGADNLFDFRQGAPPQRQVAIDTCGQRSYQPSPQ